MKEGAGTMFYASGRADVLRFEKDADEGEGARWSVDRQMAWRLLKGDVVEEIALEEASKIAERLGAPVPSLSAADSPIMRATGGSMVGGSMDSI